ncbi:hypothetical protein RRG08_034529 [Elysia crispata]|uniref:Uncharacterized protein n=1 Tax=Elysia crispata TaxID=231223 RepID=A0AAE1BAE5_9GAST|nr:hypothetical protein RRG08_034529 [Elysia crispata]
MVVVINRERKRDDFAGSKQSKNRDGTLSPLTEVSISTGQITEIPPRKQGGRPAGSAGDRLKAAEVSIRARMRTGAIPSVKLL